MKALNEIAAMGTDDEQALHSLIHRYTNDFRTDVYVGSFFLQDILLL